jgi:hypothetical protein
MRTVAAMEFAGPPINVPLLEKLRGGWDPIKTDLIMEVDKDYSVFDGTTFKLDRFAAYLERNNIPWPRTKTGRIAKSEKIFRQKASTYPQLMPLKDLLWSLGQLRLNDLQVGHDGRNRALLSPFRSKTGRNQPSNTKFVFGPAVWLRGIIKPGPGCAIAYIDYEQQEFGIAAKLSGDPAMLAAYQSGDPYLEFAKQCGAVPQDATKKTHELERDQHKQCVLAVQYGQEADAPVHDAVLIHAPVERIDADVAAMRKCMAEASKIILSGFELRTEAKVVSYPDHYQDKRGVLMWERIMKLIGEGSGN